MIQLTLTLKMTTAQVVETSVTVNNNSPIQDYVHPDDQTQPPFNSLMVAIFYFPATLALLPRASIAFLSRLKLPSPSLSNACHAGYGYFDSVRTLGQAPFSCDPDLNSISAALSGN